MRRSPIGASNAGVLVALVLIIGGAGAIIAYELKTTADNGPKRGPSSNTNGGERFVGGGVQRVLESGGTPSTPNPGMSPQGRPGGGQRGRTAGAPPVGGPGAPAQPSPPATATSGSRAQSSLARIIVAIDDAVKSNKITLTDEQKKKLSSAMRPVGRASALEEDFTDKIAAEMKQALTDEQKKAIEPRLAALGGDVKGKPWVTTECHEEIQDLQSHLR